MRTRDYLLDVSRLIWRRWSRRLPTGIDRVCLEYVQQFRGRAHAVIQYRGGVVVLAPEDSDRLFDLVREESARFRRRLVALLVSSLGRSGRSPPRAGMRYFNVGHTGLHRTNLVRWIARYRVKAVYLLHDLIPITHPQYCRPGEAAKHRLRTCNMLVSAAGIICNSAVTQAALREFAKTSDTALPPSVVAWISGAPAASGIQKHLDQDYFITIGTIEARKNHLLLLEVWKSLVTKLGSQAPLLVIIGQRGWEAHAAIAILDKLSELKDHVCELGRCDDEDLASWLIGARALLMPSFVEGFGLPVVEALQLGVPVIASDLPVYHEIAGNLPSYLNPTDAESWGRLIIAFMGDGGERARQIRDMHTYQPPDWASHFTIIEDWVQRL